MLTRSALQLGSKTSAPSAEWVPAEAPTWVENEPWVSRKSLIDGSSALRQALGLGQHLRGTPVDDLAAEPHPVEVTHTE